MITRRLTLTALVAISTTAAAQVVMLPLDSRPATSDLPARIAALSGQPVLTPPTDLLGTAPRGADPAALSAWLAAQPAAPLIASLDALAYGGLVQSRTSPISTEQALANLAPVRAWHEKTGQPVYAFITLPREPDALDRARNLAVVREMLNWARDGVFKELHVTWDDAKAGSPAPREGAALREYAPDNVRIYPGADEVLAALAARALAPDALPLAVEYSDPKKAQQVIAYEGVPLVDSVLMHAEAAGFNVVPSTSRRALTPFGGTATTPTAPTDLTLYVYNGGDPRAAALRVSQLLRERGAVAVADVGRVNMANFAMWTDLGTLDRPRDLASLAGWGTPGNNLGSALAHARVLLHARQTQTQAPELAARQDELLARELANSVIFSVKLRPAIRAAVGEANMNTPEAARKLEELARAYFPLSLNRTYELKSAGLPWGRSFEWQFDLQPTGEK